MIWLQNLTPPGSRPALLVPHLVLVHRIQRRSSIWLSQVLITTYWRLWYFFGRPTLSGDLSAQVLAIIMIISVLLRRGGGWGADTNPIDKQNQRNWFPRVSLICIHTWRSRAQWISGRKNYWKEIFSWSSKLFSVSLEININICHFVKYLFSC